MKTEQRKDLARVLLFAGGTALLFNNEAFHIDETPFLMMARQILKDPWHPNAFLINWYGTRAPWSEVSVYPSIHAYFLAFALSITGGVEWAMRLMAIPFDLISAFFLFQIAAKFLKKPLWPTFIAMATPAYFINMPHLMCEKFQAAFCFLSIYCLILGVDEDRPDWFWMSAALAGIANLVKLSSVFLIPTGMLYTFLQRKKSTDQILLYGLIGMLPTLTYFAWGFFAQDSASLGTWRWIDHALHFPWTGWIHRLRSVLAFIGASGVVTMIWPWRMAVRQKKILCYGIPCLLVSLLLFIPWFDWRPANLFDRLFGITCSAGGLLGLVLLFLGNEKSSRGWNLWAPWALSVVTLQFLLYWAVSTRYTLFMLPPLIFAGAAWFESRENFDLQRYLYIPSCAGTLMLSLLLGRVDYHYASAQKEISGFMSRQYISKGRKVWFTGHWGLQYYMENAGAEGLDLSRGGWDEVSKGDAVLIPTVNSNMIPYNGSRDIYGKRVRVQEPIPLRLMRYGTRHAGFYSSIWGFLPYTLSADPIDEFSIIEY